jgi:hypothetical protein
MEFTESWATSGGKTGPRTRITLLRDTQWPRADDMQTVYLDQLHSPFGVALVGNDLSVANTDAIVKYPYQTNETKVTVSGEVLTSLQGGPIDHHWTKSLVATPDGSKLCAMAITATKTGLVAAIFMELRHRSGVVRAFAAAGFFWLAILLWLGLTDFLTRT